MAGLWSYTSDCLTILVWLKTPREGNLRIALSSAKALIAGGWWLLLGVFIYCNFFTGDLNPADEKPLVAVLLLLGCSPILFWLGRSNRGTVNQAIVCAKGFLSLIWILLLALSVYLGFVFSPLDLVQDQIVSREDSPDGAYAVAVVDSFGGATVNNNTLVVIRPKGGSINTKHDQVLFHMDGIKKVHLIWTGAGQLTIQHEGGEVYEQLSAWKNIAIVYAISKP